MSVGRKSPPIFHGPPHLPGIDGDDDDEEEGGDDNGINGDDDDFLDNLSFLDGDGSLLGNCRLKITIIITSSKMIEIGPFLVPEEQCSIIVIMMMIIDPCHRCHHCHN